MRACITLLVAVATILASSGAATSSGPTQLVHMTSFESVNDASTGNNDARFLRKRPTDDSDDLSAEERGGLMGAVKKLKTVFRPVQKPLTPLTPEEKALKLLSTNPNDLLKQNVNPEELRFASQVLQLTEKDPAKLASYRLIASTYNTRYRLAKAISHSNS
ncbi:hypothetical protein PF005_g24737 [Phytophthora fragariae]|uniref:RxLR effector protein n=2 Tax=Phytophthora TaxID=4783 RepID=A0A6A3I5X2_9STRA|nr:hypothetical protein PF003_g29110 [Phytophthora fragariae]KAE8924251.1 hypothetical protein PF009_g25515 [Phytophthora fragariae]KAE8978349.1 hypothetical protein PF011_g23281 [Phytophthora fragariae]KAE9077384.1 hypothetical protein PF007_g24264 [Phytophthora fragariae]KAE9082149.1 hypothetical protein PF010_g21704 [Phytophthora fragariae]